MQLWALGPHAEQSPQPRKFCSWHSTCCVIGRMISNKLHHVRCFCIHEAGRPASPRVWPHAGVMWAGPAVIRGGSCSELMLKPLPGGPSQFVVVWSVIVEGATVCDTHALQGRWPCAACAVNPRLALHLAVSHKTVRAWWGSLACSAMRMHVQG